MGNCHEKHELTQKEQMSEDGTVFVRQDRESAKAQMDEKARWERNATKKRKGRKKWEIED